MSALQEATALCLASTKPYTQSMSTSARKAPTTSWKVVCICTNARDATKGTIAMRKVWPPSMTGNAPPVTIAQGELQTHTTAYQEPISRRRAALKRRIASHAQQEAIAQPERAPRSTVYQDSNAYQNLQPCLPAPVATTATVKRITRRRNVHPTSTAQEDLHSQSHVTASTLAKTMEPRSSRFAAQETMW